MTPGDAKALREALGLTQAQLAAVLCCAQTTVATWEREGKSPMPPLQEQLIRSWLRRPRHLQTWRRVLAEEHE